MDTQIGTVQAMTEQNIKYKVALDNAVDDAVISLVEVDSKRELILNKNLAVRKFYESLYSNFSILTDTTLQEQLKVFTPVILITDEDGYYIQFDDLCTVEGETVMKQTWTEKRPYAYEDDNLVYSFTLNDYIRLYDKNTGEIEEGKYQDMATLYPGNEILNDAARYDEVRRNTIVNSLIEDMNYYINQHNRIAEHFGISYNFALPYIQQEDWYRTIDDIGMLVIFQGYPYGAFTDDVFNQYSFAGARIRKTDSYYITTEADGRTFYHKGSCSNVTDTSYPYYSKKECAMEGAWPCLDCNP